MFVALAAVLAVPAVATAETIQATPDGYQVVPTQNSAGTASFRAQVNRKAQTIEYELAWQNLGGDILQSHIHFGRRATNGDIVLFPCTNLGNTPPSATPAPTCDGARERRVTGVLQAGNIVDLAFGGIQPAQQLLPFGGFEGLVDAIDAWAWCTRRHTRLGSYAVRSRATVRTDHDCVTSRGGFCHRPG